MFKRGPGNTNQDSLSLSISGSGSLHSWNLEATEELSDLEEDSDGLYLNTSLPEEEGTEGLVAACEGSERGQRENRESPEEVEMERHGNQAQETDDRNLKLVKVEAEEERQDKGNRRSFIEAQVAESVELQEERLKEYKENVINQEGAEDEELQINKMQKGLTGPEEEKEPEKAPENIVHPEEEEHEQEDTPGPETTVSPGPPSVAADPEPVAEQKSEELIKFMGQNVRQTPPPPKVRSAVALFQCQGSSQGFQVKPRIRAVVEPGKPCNSLWSRENTQTHSSQASNISGENSCSDAQEEENRPPVKVSELKKKFEA